jgi:Protein of unknown function (DUF2931)
MKIQKTVIFAKNILLVSSLFFFFACKKNIEVKDWSASLSAPPFFKTHIMVTFCKEGRMIGGISAASNESGWASPSQFERVQDNTVLPDSIFVEWTCPVEHNKYEAALKLPYKKIETLFNDSYINVLNQKDVFNNFMVGVAPGGNVCVWLNHVELLRFKAKNVGKEVWTKEEILSFEKDEYYKPMREYIKHHPINYADWEKPDPRYDLDFGFCTQNQKIELQNFIIISKEGMVNSCDPHYIEKTSWGIPCGEPVDVSGAENYQQFNEYKKQDYKMPLPVHAVFNWLNHSNPNNTIEYLTDVVFPKDFPRRYAKPYINPKTGKQTNYNRIVFGVENDSEHCVLWLDGPNKQEKIMRFKGKKTQVSYGKIDLSPGDYATEITYY